MYVPYRTQFLHAVPGPVTTCFCPSFGAVTICLFAWFAPQCHAPTCIQFDLYNAESGELICRQKPVYGKGTNSSFDEAGYINVPPCVFGAAEEGLLPPPGGDGGLPFSTRLFSRKTCHADLGHHGEMSLWQTYGLLA